MFRLILVLSALAVPLSACVPADAPPAAKETASTAAKPGSSFATAIMIKEMSESTGIAAEYAWIKANRPGWKVVQQGLADHNGRYYDILTIQKGGASEELYFDISNFFGNL